MASQNVETFRAAHQAFNARDFDAVVARMLAGCAYRDNPRGVTYTGPAAFKEFMQGWVDAFSDAKVADPAYLDAGNTVVCQFRARGTNDGSLGPLPATGRSIDIPFCEIFQFDGEGRMASGGIYYDQMTMLAQLGHAEAPALPE